MIKLIYSSICKNKYNITMADQCTSSSGRHHFILVAEQQQINGVVTYSLLCNRCGKEDRMENSCVVDISHQHDYRNYSCCSGGFHIFHCTYLGCDSILRLVNTSPSIDAD